MLGYISMNGAPGEADRLLNNLAADLEMQGVRLAGAVQTNIDLGADCACDMELRVLGDEGPIVRISQSLGTESQGCRLDAGALETAVERARRALEAGAELVILNKFAKQESYGRGFRDVIALALDMGVPVLTYVPDEHVAAFTEFAGDFASPVAHQDAAVWCRTVIRKAA